MFARAMLIRMSVAATLVLYLVIGSGCGEGEPSAERECDQDIECEEGLVCDQTLGMCVAPRVVRPDELPGTGDGDGDPAPGDGDEETGDGDEDPAPGDAEIGDGDGDPAPGDGDGDPAPGDGETGDGDGEPLEPCTQEFDACDADEREQGDFVCLEQEGGEGVCFSRCDRPTHADTCGVGSYCLDVSATTGACLPSECSSHSDCLGDTCIQFDNSYGTCVEAGPLEFEDSCVTGGERCEQGHYCDAPPGEAGRCMPICDPFSSNPCADDFYEACSVRWRRSGVCTTYPYLDDQEDAFYGCDDLGAWCTHGVQCRSFGGDSFCLPYCRPGAGDCDSRSYPDGTPTICDNYWFAGDQSIGVCVQACSGDCGGDLECVDEICRFPCPSGDPQVDCCSGAGECNYQCIDGYCA